MGDLDEKILGDGGLYQVMVYFCFFNIYVNIKVLHQSTGLA